MKRASNPDPLRFADPFTRLRVDYQVGRIDATELRAKAKKLGIKKLAFEKYFGKGTYVEMKGKRK